MISQTTTTRQARPSWRTGEAETITETWTQIEGTCTEVTEHRPYEGSRQVTLVHRIDAGAQTVTVKITGQLAQTADGTHRGLPQRGERVSILAKRNPEGSPAAAQATYGANSARVTVLDA